MNITHLKDRKLKVHFSTLAIGDIFSAYSADNVYMKILPSAAGHNCISLDNSTLNQLPDTKEVTPLDDELTVLPKR